MNINTKNLVSITEANQNFSRVARMVDESGAVVILKKQYAEVSFDRIRQSGSGAVGFR